MRSNKNQPASKMQVQRFAIREEGYFSILQGPEMGLREWTRCVQGHNSKLTLSKTYFFVVEKYIDDVKQDEKHIPDLLESMMKGSGLVKEELRLISSKMIHLDPKSPKSGCPLFGCPENRRIPARGQHSLLAQ